MKTEHIKMSLFKKILLAIISIIIFIIQLSFYYFIFFTTKDITWIRLTVRIIGFICVISLFNNESMCSTYKLIWGTTILLFGFAGPLMFLLFGNQRSMPKHKSRKVEKYLNDHIEKNDILDKLKDIDKNGYKCCKLINSYINFPVYQNTDVKYFNDINDKLEYLLNDLKNAQKYIYIETFILSTGKMLDMIIDILEQKGKEGVEIKILYDNVGSMMTLKKHTINKLKSIPNLKLFTYEPLGISINPAVNFRDHRKITIIDGIIGYVGGDNIADEYCNFITKYGKWRDNSARLYGDACKSLLLMFCETWYMSSKETIDVKEKTKDITHSSTNDSFIMPYCDGPTNSCNPAYYLYSLMTSQAQNYLYISTPYIAIDEEFIDNIITTCKSGVDVRILVPGIPDKKLVYKTTQSYYSKILKAGGKIYEYTEGFNHAKNYISDDKYGIIGSINVDYRSLYLHFENAALLINDKEVLEMKKDFLETLTKCKEIKYEEWEKRKLSRKLLEFVLRVFSAIM